MALTKAIHRAIAEVAKEHVALADHLRSTVHTGWFFSYDPPSSPPPWRF